MGTDDMTTTLVKFEAARRALAEAKSVDEVKKIRDHAEAFRVYCKQAGESLEMQNWCAEIKQRAERKAGDLLLRMNKDTGGGDTSGGSRVKPPQEGARLDDLGITKTQSHRWQKLATIPEPTFEKYIQNTKERKEELTTAGLLRAGKMGVHYSSETPEWYTPAHVIRVVVDVMRGIDLYPCADPGKSVPATSHYTAEDDGLSREWIGRVYMNPPYGKEIEMWVHKLVCEYTEGRVTEAIALVPSRTDTRWFRVFTPYPCCFIAGRLKFGEALNSAPFPSMAVYLGDNDDRFAVMFSKLGDIYDCRNTNVMNL